MTNSIENLNVKLFADGANLQNMLEMYSKPYIKGLTTNPTLMRSAGVSSYKEFATQALSFITDKPISFEVFSDEFEEMKKQAIQISSWGKNVFVKIPVTNTIGMSTVPVISDLVQRGVQVNVTALMTTEQVEVVADALSPEVSSYVSVFAGRIADTGRDPQPIMSKALDILKPLKRTELIWASPREFLNVIQANQIGCHVITATSEILNKVKLLGKDLTQYSLETVQMFQRDAEKSNFRI
jgi:transaldolase